MASSLSYLAPVYNTPSPTAVVAAVPTSAVTSSATSAIATASATASMNTASPSVAGAVASATASAAPMMAVSTVKSFVFLYHINILILVLFAIFFVAVLPRVITARMAPRARFTGFFLLSGGGSADAPPARRPTESMHHDDDDTQTLHNNNPFEDGQSMVMPRDVAPVVFGTPGGLGGTGPMRVRSLLSLHPLLGAIANYSVLPGWPLRKLAVFVVYFGIYLYAGLYRNNPFASPYRAGVLGASQIPLVVACVMKNNFIQYLTGVAYEKLNYVHRFAGRLIVLAINVHALQWFFTWNRTPGKITSEYQTDLVRWGTVGLVAVDLLFIGSLPAVRAKSYSLFLATHVLGFFWFVVAMYIHYPQTLPYFVTAFVFYGYDHVARAARTRVTTAYITPQPALNGGSTHVALPGLATGWRAGQHVRMRVVNPSLPSAVALPFAILASRIRAHPYSAASAPNANGLELIIKKVGASTRSLYSLAGGEEAAIKEKKAGMGMVTDPEAAFDARRVKVIVEGPYSGPAARFEGYSGVVLVAGGSGITYTLSLLQDLLAVHSQGGAATRVVELVWSVADPGSLLALLPTLRELLQPRTAPAASLQLRIRVHYTRAPRTPPPPADLLPAGLALLPGRPSYGRIIEDACDAVRDAVQGSPRGLAVSHCGPGELGAQIHGAVGNLSWSRWKEAGGVEVHAESFGW